MKKAINPRKKELKEIKSVSQKLDTPYSKTKGFKKLWNYFLAVFENDYFNNQIFTIRKRYKIPKNGFEGNKEKDLWENATGWKYTLEIFDDIDALAKKFDIYFPFTNELIEKYLYFNEVNSSNNLSGLCFISDIIQEKENPFELSVGNKDKAYPISIRISPYASLRDIQNFIQKLYTAEIEPLQIKYRDSDVKIGKIKSKKQSVQDRNKFIYKNRNLPRRQIKALVKDNFNEIIDYEYVGKIISNEKKKRKKL